MAAFNIEGVYAITPESPNTDQLLNKTQQALEGGTKLVQYRNKSTNRRLQKKQAELLLQLCKQYQVPLIINDHLELVEEINADGLHVGCDDASIVSARNRLGNEKIIGTSCYNDLDRALHAQAQGTDYIAFGAFYPSTTKLNTVSISIDFMLTARSKIQIPIVGIGGIQLHNAATVIQSGCDAIALSNGLFANEHIRATTKQFMQLFNTHP